jgi:transposase
MIRIRLPQDEALRLQRQFRQTDDRRLRDRLQIVLMAHQGRQHQGIAADLGVAPRTVQRWLNAYLDRGLDGLRPRKAPGAKAKVPAALADEVRRWVIDGPAACGLDRANWTHEGLADHLYKAKGIRASRAAVGRFCRKLGIRLYRPSYRYLRGDPDQQAQARAEQAELKRGRRRASLSC